ncbi:MAG: hypothetical protein CM1200mP30_01990 [Pseudomonadota bacterium]|nr:MAG: hypothetical protein CM1200mP30_01990 [Pseudomonadota bacterium]
MIKIDQTPIGRTPRSNPATYTKVLDPIRELFSMTPEQRARGIKRAPFPLMLKEGDVKIARGQD